MARPRTHDQALKLRLLDEAGRLLVAEGPAGLTVRRLAELSGTSASAVYSLFGDKWGLVEAMFNEGFRRLSQRFAELRPTSDPAADLLALGQAFRAGALANPHLYDLMFGCPFPEFHPAEPNATAALGTFTALVAGVQRCLDAGLLGGGDAMQLALFLFGQVHGLTGLELNGWLGPREQADRLWDLAMRVTFEGLRAEAPGSRASRPQRRGERVGRRTARRP
ncbi:MAG: TetR/AcrR family transcriptional regulator [Candidatus Dormibacteria bacterium]